MVTALLNLLDNAWKYSGEEKQIVLTAEARDGGVAFAVRDNGIGLGRSGRRSGLANLEERALLLGGTFSVGPAGDAGTELRWQVPLGKASSPAG
ncbi:MAG TPA: hypothetical protein DEH11_03995 [Actinobacteria bacterium]|nr:hypothetical protein [Actinomycetota bacterium]